MERKVIGAQGEITIFAVSALPEGLVPFTEIDKAGRAIISHSESGNHHLLDAPGVTVLEKPVRLFQDAPDAHGEHVLPAGVIEFRLAREFDPFAEQIRRVAD